jgi:ribonuclease HI
MQWMTQGMPSTTPFIYAVYQSIGFGKMEGNVKLTYDAKQCIHMCRILTICHVGFPNAMSTQIDAHVYPDTDDYEMWVDACTGKGGGGYIVRNHGDGTTGTTVVRKFVVRWTTVQLEYIAEHPGIINVLEYVISEYAICSWSDLLTGCATLIHTDNKAALSWLQSQRTKGVGNVQQLVKIAVLFKRAKNMMLRYEYIDTHSNVYADWLSRDDDLQECDGLTEVTRGPPGSASYMRVANCRRLLTLALSEPSETHMQSLLDLVLLLL